MSEYIKKPYKPRNQQEAMSLLSEILAGEEITLIDLHVAQKGFAVWEIQVIRDKTFSRLESYPPILLPTPAKELGFVMENEYVLVWSPDTNKERTTVIFPPLEDGAMEYLSWHEEKLFVLTQNKKIHSISVRDQMIDIECHGIFDSVDSLSLVPEVPEDVLEFLEHKLYSPQNEYDKQLLN